MPDKILDISLFGGTPEWALIADKENSKDPLTIAYHVRNEVRLLLTAFNDEVDRVQSNTDLTDIGKAKQIKEVSERSSESLAKLRATLSAVEEAKGKAADSVAKKITPEEKLVAAIEQSEIRRYLNEQTGGDALKVKLAYQDALEAKDFTTMDAIENAPHVWPGRISDDDLSEMRKHRLEITDPRLGKEVSYLDDAYTDTSSVIEFVSGEVRAAMGGLPNDVVGDTAAR